MTESLSHIELLAKLHYEPRTGDFTWKIDGKVMRACDMAGEWAEDFPALSREKVEDLGKLISDWLDANLSVNFYTVKNSKEIIITEEMIAEHRS